MNKTSNLLCADWGTSNFRLFLTNIETEELLGVVEFPKGVAVLFQEWQSQKKVERVVFFRNFLQKKILELEKKLQIQLDGIPLVLSGMASSSIGIIEVPYANLPFNLSQPHLHFEKLESTSQFPNECFIFGGLSQSNDVMRGEETQILGLQNHLKTKNCLCILPGTHSKHILIKEGQVVDFKTFMTGELFHLISNHSILKNSIIATKVFTSLEEDWFKKGVEKAQNTNLLNALFAGRTNDILHQVPAQTNYFFISGLLIGSELKDLAETEEVLLCCDSQLFLYYQLALELLLPKATVKHISPSVMKMAIPKAHINLYRGQESGVRSQP
jgi:2-dehydro-3-deoxygalactonokinase